MLTSRAKERRRFQRITVVEPVVARLGSTKVLILNISLQGASIESQTQLKSGEELRLTFRWDEQDLSIDARVIRSMLRGFSEQGGQSVYHSGLTFQNIEARSARVIRQMIGDYITRALEARKTNARMEASHSDGGLQGVDPDELAALLSSKTFRGTSHLKKPLPYITFQLNEGKWSRRPTTDPKQPIDGFTLADVEDSDEQKLLCKTYERVDPEWRTIIRLFAEISVTEPDEIEPRRFLP